MDAAQVASSSPSGTTTAVTNRLRCFVLATALGLAGCGGTVDDVAPLPVDAASEDASGSVDATTGGQEGAPDGSDATVAACEGGACQDSPMMARDGGDGGDAADAPHTADGCTPRTCADFPPGTCGAQVDGCSGLTAVCAASDAGLCPPGQFCGGGGPTLCGRAASGDASACVQGCVPLTCFSYPPGTCGQQSDGCGGITPDCNVCPAPLTCSGTIFGICSWPADAGVCVPSTCHSLGVECGVFTDGCGNTIDCGTCPLGQFCGGGGSHRCGGTCDPDAAVCGVLTCTSDAGSCPDYYPCGTGAGGCGLVPGRCGGLYECDPCPEAAAPEPAPEPAAE